MFCYWELKAFLVLTFFWHSWLMLIKSMLSFQVMTTPVLSVHYSDWITYYCPQCQTPEIIAQPTSECFVFARRHPYHISLLFLCRRWIIGSVPKAKSLIWHLSGKPKKLNHKIIQNRSVIQITRLMCLCLCYSRQLYDMQQEGSIVSHLVNH